MIYITGDTHGEVSRFEEIHEQYRLTEKDMLIVAGDLGCGAFRNDPKVVAKAYASVLKDCRYHFDLIEFAIFCRDFETENYDAFVEALA